VEEGWVGKVWLFHEVLSFAKALILPDPSCYHYHSEGDGYL